MTKFDLEQHVISGLSRKTLKEATEFAKLHGYTIRVVKKWFRGNWSHYVISKDYDSKRINVGVDDSVDANIDYIEGLG